MPLKTCLDCGYPKELEEFYPTTEGRNGVQAYCKLCARKRFGVSHRALKREVFDHYGGSCYCCGETNIGFLGLDHIHRDGVKDGKRGRGWYLKLKREGFPGKDRYRVACHNCNMGREANGGVCPHNLSAEVEGVNN